MKTVIWGYTSDMGKYVSCLQKCTAMLYFHWFVSLKWGVALTVYPWYLLCSLGILGDNLPINTHYIGLIVRDFP